MFRQKIEVDNSRIAQVLKPVQAAKPVRQQNLRRSPRSDSWHTCAHTGQQSSHVIRGFGEQLAASFKRDHPRYFDGVNYFDFVEGVEGRIQTTQLRPKFSLRRALLLGVTAFLPLSFAQTAQAQETTPVSVGQMLQPGGVQLPLGITATAEVFYVGTGDMAAGDLRHGETGMNPLSAGGLLTTGDPGFAESLFPLGTAQDATGVLADGQGHVDDGIATNYADALGFKITFSQPMPISYFYGLDIDAARDEWQTAFGYDDSGNFVAPDFSTQPGGGELTVRTGITPTGWGLSLPSGGIELVYKTGDNTGITPATLANQVLYDFEDVPLKEIYFLFGLERQSTFSSATNANASALSALFVPNPEMDVTKTATVGALQADNTFDITYDLLIENTGGVAFESFSLTDDLAASSNLGSVFNNITPAGVTFAPVVSAGGSDFPAPNPAFDGNGASGIDELIDPADSVLFQPGDSFRITFTANVDAGPSAVTLPNLATASAQPVGFTGSLLTEDSDDDGDDNNGDNPTVITTPVAAGPTGTPAPTAPVITSCSYGELFEFDNSGSIVFSANPSNNQLFTAQSVQNGTTFDFTILDRSPSSNPLLTPLSGTAHNQSGGTATNGGIQILATANSALSSEVDITVGMSGGFATELEFYVHDIEVTENAVFGATDFVAGSLGAHPGATLNIDQSTNTIIATAANTDGESNRSALATYQNINGLTSLTQTHTISSGRLGTGFALGSYCVSQVEAVTETFPAVTGAGGGAASVLTSDTLNGEILDPADVNFTLGAITGPDGNPSTAITLNADRTVTVPAGAAPGDYTVEYEFCDTVNPTNCDTAIETITVTAPILPPPLPPLNPGVCGGVLAEAYLLDGMGIGFEALYQLASGSSTHDPDAFFGIFGAEPAYIKNADGSVTYYFDGEAPLQAVSTDINTPAAIGNITSVNGNDANQTDAAEFWRITARVDGVPGQTYNYTLDNGGAHEFLHYWLEDSAGNIIDSSLDDPNTANGWLYGTGQTFSTSSENGATSISASQDTPISYTIPASSPDGIVYLRVMVLDPQSAWGNLNFTNAPSCLTELLVNKTMAVYDPTNIGLYSIPGNDVIYTFTISNDGNGAVDVDTIKLLDILPPEFDFWNGDIDDGGPESFPVTFAQTVGTGMSLTYATDIRFGTGSTPPANFDACSTVAPDSSYRPDLTYICFNPKGVLSAGDPNPTIELKFRGRIK